MEGEAWDEKGWGRGMAPTNALPPPHLIVSYLTLEQTICVRPGEVTLTNRVTMAPKLSNLISSIPRVGLSFQLPTTTSAARFLGNGPHENYCDRSSGASEPRPLSALLPLPGACFV